MCLQHHITLNVIQLNEKQFDPTEVTRVNVVSSRALMAELYEVSNVGMVGMFVGKQPVMALAMVDGCSPSSS